MNVLATTSQSVLLVDCTTGDALVVHRGDGLYYGIAQIGTMYAVAARRRLVSSPVARTDERGCILMFDERFRLRDTIEAPFLLRDIHQIAWFDDRLWVTCSFDDFVAVYSGSAWEQWIPERPPHGADRSNREAVNDRYHFNSFHVAGDDIVLLAHNHGPSDLHFFDRRSRVLRGSLGLGRQAHNIWRERGAYLTCSSIDGKIVATDGWDLATGGFPRGVSFDATRRAVGISALSERGQRDWASAAIALYDASWRLGHYVHLVSEGMLLDLALVSPHAMSAVRADGALQACRYPLLQTLTEADLLGDQGSGGNVST